MQVILIKNLRKRGKIGDLIEVKDGYARNYLLLKDFAIRATAENKNLIEKQKHELEAENLLAKTESEKLAQEIVGKDLTFIRQSSEDGRLFGSVSNKDIAKVLSELLSREVSHTCIALPAGIKTVGVFTVEIDLHAEVSTDILVIVARSETAANTALQNYKASIAAPISEEEVDNS